jgi:hypothetical protein
MRRSSVSELHVSLLDELLGSIDKVACGDLDLLCPGAFILRSDAIHGSGLFAHGLSTLSYFVRLFCTR